MNIGAEIKTNSKFSKVETISQNSYKIFVKSPAHEGKANIEAIRLLSEYFKIPKSNICLVRGIRSKVKTFKLEGIGSDPH